jgi:5-methylcytosine-specific restriction endonuclease McrA
MERTCKNSKCGGTFEARSIIHAFCSEECRKAARGPEYRTNRELALIRDGYACTECDAVSPLECHHIDPLCLGGDNSLGNLQTLCRTCHRAKHKDWRAAAYDREARTETRPETTPAGRGYDHAA